MISKRIEFIDSLKGITIFFVIWGHSIQYLRNGSVFFHNPIFEFIYSFHMPLFFMISGFFFKSSLKLNLKEFLYKKGIQLLLPCFIWGILFVGFDMIKNQAFNWDYIVNKLVNPLHWPFWFLKELFLSYFLVYASYKVSRKKWIALTISLCIVLISPYCGFQRFLLPMFIAGILLKDNYQYLYQHLKLILFSSGFVFFVCLYFWTGDDTIYIAEFPKMFNPSTFSFNFTNINISVFRLITGLSGSLFWFLLFQKIYRKNWMHSQLQKAGILTLNIYVLQATLLENIANKTLNFRMPNLYVYNFIITPLISVLIILVCIGLSTILSKNKIVALLLFGISEKKPPLPQPERIVIGGLHNQNKEKIQ